MITGVHFIEAYGLNPAIYSAHLKVRRLDWQRTVLAAPLLCRQAVLLARRRSIRHARSRAHRHASPTHMPSLPASSPQLHPLLVLTVLVVAEHSLGVWGLLLAVPLTVFTLDYVLR